MLHRAALGRRSAEPGHPLLFTGKMKPLNAGTFQSEMFVRYSERTAVAASVLNESKRL